VGLIVKRCKTSFYATTKYDHLNNITMNKWKGEERDRNMKMVDLTLNDHDCEKDRQIEYRNKYYIKCRCFLKRM